MSEHEGVGRTNDVKGEITISGDAVTKGSFTVDMASVTSDQDRRDGQFRGRIMSVSTFPTSTFELTDLIKLGTIPADGAPFEATATGKLTLRGTTKTVTFRVQAQRASSTVKDRRQHPDRLRRVGHPQPELRPRPDEDNGLVEFLLVLAK